MQTKAKRQVFPAGLWVVATPIGNLEDLTPRAKQALQDADAILCEDTRRTRVLLSALGMDQSEMHLHRLDAHQEVQSIDYWVRELLSGKTLALVSDAGTPTLSDPGARLIGKAQEQGVIVTPFPGASALLCLLSVAGFLGTAFTFRGFFPRDKSDQRNELREVFRSSISRSFVWYESPMRIEAALEFLSLEHPDEQVVVGKEITKLHEKFFCGDAKIVFEKVRKEILEQGKKGEWCFGVSFKDYFENENLNWIKPLVCLIEAKVPASEASKIISQQFGASKKDVYEEYLNISGKKLHKKG